MQRRHSLLILAASVLLTAACQRDAVPAAKVDEMAILPRGAADKSQFVRFYLRKPIRNNGEAPFFTLSRQFTLDRRRDVWLSVQVLPALWAPNETPGVRVVTTDGEMPKVMDGGCGVVNLIADARTGETLSSWCNVRLAPEGPVLPLSSQPYYDRPGSPFAGEKGFY